MSGDHHNLDLEDELPRRSGLPPIAKYVCGAAFALSAGLAIPFFWAKSRAAVPRAGVHLSGPGAVGSGPAALLARPSHSTALGLSKPPPRLLKTSRANEEAPPDTVGAITHAFKALGAATLMVGIGVGTAFAGVTFGLGITTASPSDPTKVHCSTRRSQLGEFQTVMRSMVRRYFPELHGQLHSVPDTLAAGRVEVWDQERAEKALEDAYARAGWRGWAVEARRQLERERAVAQLKAEYEKGRN